MTGERLISADLLKLFAIFLVLWGHCLQQFLENSVLENSVYVFIYSFHMPLFMVLSGYFSFSSLQLKFCDVLLKKARQLLLPFLSWSLFIFALRMFLGNMLPEYFPIISPGNAFVGAFGNFWFLKSLFFCYMLAWCGKNSRLSARSWVLLTLFFSQFFPWYNVKVMYPCFLFGLAMRYYSHFIVRHRFTILLFSLSLFILMSCFWNGDFLKPADLVGAVRNCDIQSIAFLLYVRIYRVLIGISASLSLYIIFTSLFDGKHFARSRILCNAAKSGRFTLGIYILQVVVLEIILGAFVNCDSMNIYVFNYVVAPLFSVVIMFFCILMYRLISRSTLLSFLFFGNPLPQETGS